MGTQAVCRPQGCLTGPLESRVLLSGSPIFAAVTPATASASVSGIVYDDKNGNGFKTRKDKGIAKVDVFLQKLKHGRASGKALEFTTKGSGDYTFTNLTPGVTYRISQDVPAGDDVTQPDTGDYTINLTAGEALTGENFGDQPQR